jgi:acyl-homoserine lactone acylase PvdQ
MMGGIMFDTNVVISHVVISHVSSDHRPAFPEWIRRYAVEHEVKQAVQAYLNGVNSPGPSRQVVARCIAACRLLDNLSDEDWEALEPLLVEEITVLHNSKVPTWWTP